jgi:hypothetical protein
MIKKAWRTLVATLLVLGLSVPLMAGPGNQGNPRVQPPQSHPHGMTYGEWSARWWQWAYSLPVDQNPFFDDGVCTNGANGQFGPVWFLTGVVNVSGTTTRPCTIPAGKALFFPILNGECATLEGNPPPGNDLPSCADSLLEPVAEVHATIDGVTVQNLMSAYRFDSPLFTYGPLPDNNVLEFFGVAGAVAGATSLSASDGWWLMLAPLPAGQHTIHFGGTLGTPPFFILDITYHLTVR